MQATPLVQHFVPHGVVPFGQQHLLAGSVQVSPLWQQPLPHVGAPASQVVALARDDLNTVAVAAATRGATDHLQHATPGGRACQRPGQVVESLAHIDSSLAAAVSRLCTP
jgi:hypothetical protein